MREDMTRDEAELTVETLCRVGISAKKSPSTGRWTVIATLEDGTQKVIKDTKEMHRLRFALNDAATNCLKEIK